jgi:phosphatidylserine decarboxylase
MDLQLSNQLIVFLQKCLPARLMGQFIYWLSRIEKPWFKNKFITGFCWLYEVDTAEAEHPIPAGYKHFNDFFTRNLREDARPIAPSPESFSCPADGTVAQLGFASTTELMQAKGMSYRAEELLGDTDMAIELADCAYITIYLAPYNYHRLHMPLAGVLEKTLFIPGRLYSVNARTAATVPGLYAVNERLVCQFNSDLGKFALVLVGAMNVASISTAWGGEIFPPADGQISIQDFSRVTGAPELARGDYMGHFNMGSTIVVLAPPGSLIWDEQVATGNIVRMGQQLGKVTPN